MRHDIFNGDYSVLNVSCLTYFMLFMLSLLESKILGSKMPFETKKDGGIGVK